MSESTDEALHPSLPMWVLYDHPQDAPDHFVARLWEAYSPQPTATNNVFLSRSLEDLRTWLAEQGLTCLPRYPEDDPVIIEVWL